MTRANWIVLIVAAGLGMGSIALIVAAWLTEGTTQNLFMSLGVTLVGGCLILFIQQLVTMANMSAALRQESRGVLGRSEDSTATTIALRQPFAVTTSEELHHEAPKQSIKIYRAASGAPSISDLVGEAREEVLAMVISGRNFFNMRVHNIILESLSDPNKKNVTYKLLALNHFSGDDYMRGRTEMMDIRRGAEFAPIYRKDFEQVREYASQVTIEDPTRSKFDVRFYGLMPTAYFYIIDGTLFIGSLLSRQIAASPMMRIPPSDEESKAVIAAYRNHFDFYWSSARFFVTLIALTDAGKTVFVRNRKRGLEWPTGFIEPNEDLAKGAVREFFEETGYTAGPAVPIDASSMGYYYAARVGQKKNDHAAREVSDVVFLDDIPSVEDLSFPDDHRNFTQYLERARQALPLLKPPPD